MNEIIELKKTILNVIRKNKHYAMTAAELANKLNIVPEDMGMFKRVLKKMVQDGEIVIVHGERYITGDVADLVTGIINIKKSGNGYLVVAGREEDLFIPQRNMGVALPGDKVLVRIEADPEGSNPNAKIGRVIEVLDRRRHDIVGTLKSTGRFLYVVPIAGGYSKNIYVDKKNGAKINDRVVVRFIDWVDKNLNPEGTIIDVIGSANDPSVDTISIIKQYEFPEEFPEKVVREAEEVSVLVEQPGERLDLRDKLIITIDPASARDFDDALSLERDGDNNLVLGVHIADVSHFVTPGSALDEEAKNRGNSIYLPDLVIPMLPEQLSNGVCSLRPDEDRLAFSVFMTIDSAGVVIKSSFAKTIIRSKARLTYEEAMGVLKKKKNTGKNNTRKIKQEVIDLLQKLNYLAQRLRKKRFAKYALEMDLPECEVVYDGNGHIIDIKKSVNDESHQLVEECMIAANEAVDMELSKQGMLLIHRFHDKPKKNKIEELKVELEKMGFAPGNLNVRRNLSKFLKQIVNHPLAYHAQVAVLRSMSRAIYSQSDVGHYGLAKSFYAHFTSPIRRYPDLVVHRQLQELLLKNKTGLYNKDELINIAQACSIKERNAEEAEFELIEIKKLRFLSEQLKSGQPRVYKAVVSRIMNFGMFVDVSDLQMQGLIHISTISNKFVRHNAEKNILRTGRIIYERGTPVEVIVAKVDFDKKRVDFSLAGDNNTRNKRRKRKSGF